MFSFLKLLSKKDAPKGPTVFDEIADKFSKYDALQIATSCLFVDSAIDSNLRRELINRDGLSEPAPLLDEVAVSNTTEDQMIEIYRGLKKTTYANKEQKTYKDIFKIDDAIKAEAIIFALKNQTDKGRTDRPKVESWKRYNVPLRLSSIKTLFETKKGKKSPEAVKLQVLEDIARSSLNMSKSESRVRNTMKSLHHEISTAASSTRSRSRSRSSSKGGRKTRNKRSFRKTRRIKN
jgi:hypothetical protein